MPIIAAPVSLVLLGTGLLSLGGDRNKFSHGSLVGDETFLKEAVTGTNKLPTPLRRGCSGLTRAALIAAVPLITEESGLITTWSSRGCCCVHERLGNVIEVGRCSFDAD